MTIIEIDGEEFNDIDIVGCVDQEGNLKENFYYTSLNKNSTVIDNIQEMLEIGRLNQGK